MLTGETPERRAAAFFNAYGLLLGIRDAATELVFRETRIDLAGGKHLIFDQTYQGIPVFGGDVRLHFNKNGGLTAVNGIFVPGLSLDPRPVLSAGDAAQAAAVSVRKQHGAGASLSVLSQSLCIFRQGLVQGRDGSDHLAFEVEVGDDADIREIVFVDAHRGNILEQITGRNEGLARRLFNINTTNQIWQEGDPFPGGLNTWQRNQVIVAGEVYYFFYHAFGRHSYDGADAEMWSINNAANVSCPNASWNGRTVNFCTGTAIDDIISHEWGHAYTQYTSGLVYAWQPGALNESYSDIWGETIDLINGHGMDTGANNPRTGCDDGGLRWLIAEESTAFNGALRDMWDPTCMNDPGKVSDRDYQCSESDFGGVHTNSGVNNHAYALLVDGGDFNGQSISGLGLTKTAHIFWHALTFYLTNISDFPMQADALEAACTDLRGVELTSLSTLKDPPVSIFAIAITAADSMEVAKASLAVEFRRPPACSFKNLLVPVAPPLCTANTTFRPIYSEDFEGSPEGWTTSEVPANGNSWATRTWTPVSSLPGDRSGRAMFGPSPFTGDCQSDLENGIIRLESPVIALPPDLTQPILMTFDHYVSMETGWDGGVLRFRRNGGPWLPVPVSAFLFNGYNGQLKTVFAGNDNPLAGQEAFTGANEGSFLGSWGQTQLDLSSLGVLSGDQIQFRWELGTDGCNGWIGWYIDDIQIGVCEAALPVELLAFFAKPTDKAIRLTWSTAQELSNRGFFLERRSAVEKDFRSIAWIPGQGTVYRKTDYQFTDEQVSPGITYYYRLRQVDEDGKAQLSHTVAGRLQGGETRPMVLFPNPATRVLFIGVTPDLDREAMEIDLLDLHGRKLRSFRPGATQSATPLSFDVQGLPPGLYLVSLRAAGRQWMEKLIIDP